MRFLKNNLKLIIGFIVGVILASGITVYAYSYFASDVKYTNEKSVADALDDLYLKSQTYRNLNTITTATADKILNGYTAYNNNGDLMTGSFNPTVTTKGIEWNSDTISVTTSTTRDLNIGFIPSFICITNTSNGNSIIYKSSISTTQQYIVGNARNLGARDDGGSSIVSVGSTTRFQSASNSSWYWIAIK